MLKKISLVFVALLLCLMLVYTVSAEPVPTKQIKIDNEFRTFSASQEKTVDEYSIRVLLPKTPEEFVQRIEKDSSLNLSSDEKLKLTKDIEDNIYKRSSKTEDLHDFAAEIKSLTGIEITDEDIKKAEEELKELMMRPLVNDVIGEQFDNTLQAKGIVQETANVPYISPDETAPFLGGSTKVVIVFVNPDGEDWEDDYYDDIVYAWNEVKKATDWMEDRALSGSDLSFVQGYYVADTSYDPENDNSYQWTEDAVKNLGFSDSDGDGSYTDDMLIFNRNYYGTDNAIAIFIPRVEGRAHAYVYGPPKNIVYFYDSCTTILWWPVCTKEEYPTYAHETLHLFGADDEYYQEWDGSGCGANSCWEPVGFSYEPLQEFYTNGNCERCNPNSVDSIMKSHWIIKTNPNAISFYAKGQLGLWDYDADGKVDPYDNCISVSNPSQSDSDGDGVGNACDNDGDNDGVNNNIDNCPTTYNPSQQNSDGDSLGDACDSDDDNDGILDSNDNCPINSNPLQENNDGDSEGDICDIDDDNDGVRDTLDNCPLVPGLSYYAGCPDTDAPQAGSSWASLGSVQPNGFVTINAYIYDPSGINYAIAKIKDSNGNLVASINLYDDGTHGDGSLSDNLYGNTWSTSTQGNFSVDFEIEDAESNLGEYTDVLKFATSTFISNSKVLLVYDDSTSYYNYFEDSLDNNNISFDYYNVYERGSPYSSLFNNYKLIIWSTGNDYKTTLTTQDQANIASYLDNSGSLFLTGQDIGYNIGSTNFYKNYLKADYIKDDTNLINLRGNSWNPYTFDTSIVISEGDGANNQYYPSEIDPLGGAWTVFYYEETSSGGSGGGGGGATAEPQKEPRYSDITSQENTILNSPVNAVESTGSAAIAFENEDYKLVYFAFGFEAIDNQEQRDEIMFEMVDFLFDLTPPEITVYRTDIYDYTLWDGFWYNNDSMNLKITTDEVVEEIRVSIDDGTEIVCFDCDEILDPVADLSQGNHTIKIYARDYYGNLGEKLINFYIDTVMPSLVISAYNSELGSNNNLVGPNSPAIISYSVDDENPAYSIFAVGDLIDIGSGNDQVEGLIMVSWLPANISDDISWNANQYRLSGQELGEVVVIYQSEEEVYGVEGRLCVPIVSAAPNSEPSEMTNVPREVEKFLHVSNNEDCTWTMAKFNSSTLALIGFDRDLVYDSSTVFSYYTNNDAQKNITLGNNFKLVEENVVDNEIFNVYFAVEDMAYNTNFSIIDLLSDTAAPVVDSSIPSSNSTSERFESLIINLSDNSGIKDIEVTATLNGEEFTGFTFNHTEDNQLNINLIKPRNGDYALNIKLKDILNNEQIYALFLQDLNVFEDVNTNIQNLSLESNDIINETEKKIIFKENNESIVSFNWDYNISDIDFSLISIIKQNVNSTEGFIIISGIDLTNQNQTKTVILDKISTTSDRICIKDIEVSLISEVSEQCNGENEISLVCPGTSGEYSCNLTANNTKYIISGLKHSAVKEYKYVEPTSPPSNGGGGGGSGGGGGGGSVSTVNKQVVNNETTPSDDDNESEGNETSAPTGENPVQDQPRSLWQRVVNLFRGGSPTSPSITGAVVGAGEGSSGRNNIMLIALVAIIGIAGVLIWRNKKKKRLIEKVNSK